MLYVVGLILSLSMMKHFLNGTDIRKINNQYFSGHIPRTCAAVIRFFGSLVSIFCTRSLALLDTDGQGLLSKSMVPLSMASNIPFSVSVHQPSRYRKSLIPRY